MVNLSCYQGRVFGVNVSKRVKFVSKILKNFIYFSTTALGNVGNIKTTHDFCSFGVKIFKNRLGNFHALRRGKFLKIELNFYVKSSNDNAQPLPLLAPLISFPARWKINSALRSSGNPRIAGLSFESAPRAASSKQLQA